jgi:hypothetical protein
VAAVVPARSPRLVVGGTLPHVSAGLFILCQSSVEADEVVWAPAKQTGHPWEAMGGHHG